MIAAEHTQSLSEFRKKAAETIARLNKTGEAEIITVNGEARAVLLSLVAYDELVREAQLSRDVAVIRRSIQQFEAGDSKEVNEFFGEIRIKLLSMKATQGNGGAP